MKYLVIIISLLLLNCSTQDPLSEKADSTLMGTVYPGIASGQKGHITVVVSETSFQENINWDVNVNHLTSFGTYEIKELVGGKYYIITHMDTNGNGQRDRDEYWGGYDANGDGRLDPVSVIGGETTIADITFFDIYD